MRGSLDDFSLVDIVGLIARARKSGALELSGSAGAGTLYFREGTVCGARCTRGREPMGRKLVRAGLLTESQLRSVIARRSGEGMRLGELLLGEGLVEHADIAGALREQIEDNVIGLLQLRPTEYAWRAGEPDEAVVSIEASSFLRAVEIRLGELDEIRSRLPSDDLTLSLNPVPPQTPDGFDVTPEQWRVLAMLGTRRSLRDLVRYSGSSDFYTLSTIDELVSSGLLEVVDWTSAAPPEVLLDPSRRRQTPAEPRDIRVEGLPRERVIRLNESSSPSERPFKIAVVSTSDRSRGPLAAAILRRETRGLPVEVSSYGIQNLVGAPPTPEALAAGQRIGAAITQSRSTPLVPGALIDSDLVLGFERHHQGAAMAKGRARPEASFTVVELSALLERPPVGSIGPLGRASAVVELAHRRRLETPVSGNREADVSPLISIEELNEASTRIATGLFSLPERGKVR